MNKPAKPPIIRANVLASVVAEVLRRGGEVEGLLRAHIEFNQAVAGVPWCTNSGGGGVSADTVSTS